jgi:hypothetical protein
MSQVGPILSYRTPAQDRSGPTARDVFAGVACSLGYLVLVIAAVFLAVLAIGCIVGFTPQAAGPMIILSIGCGCAAAGCLITSFLLLDAARRRFRGARQR